MTAFSASWLTLREPADAAARSDALIAALTEAMPARPLIATDLATGTGANLRALCPALGGTQHWRLVDHDAALLAELTGRLSEWGRQRGGAITVDEHPNPSRIERGSVQHDVAGRSMSAAASIEFDCRVRISRLDLASHLDDLELPLHAFVSASALLDLVSAAWIETLARRCRAARAPILFALTYDGRIEFVPEDPDDALVRALVNRHQRRDKGFGPALGPDAASVTQQAFEKLGYRIWREFSDWRLTADDAALQEALLEGWVDAAVEMAPADASRLQHWRERRRVEIDRGDALLTVGHVDLMGLPAH